MGFARIYTKRKRLVIERLEAEKLLKELSEEKQRELEDLKGELDAIENAIEVEEKSLIKRIDASEQSKERTLEQRLKTRIGLGVDVFVGDSNSYVDFVADNIESVSNETLQETVGAFFVPEIVESGTYKVFKKVYSDSPSTQIILYMMLFLSTFIILFLNFSKGSVSLVKERKNVGTPFHHVAASSLERKYSQVLIVNDASKRLTNAQRK